MKIVQDEVVKDVTWAGDYPSPALTWGLSDGIESTRNAIVMPFQQVSLMPCVLGKVATSKKKKKEEEKNSATVSYAKKLQSG